MIICFTIRSPAALLFRDFFPVFGRDRSTFHSAKAPWVASEQSEQADLVAAVDFPPVASLDPALPGPDAAAIALTKAAA